MKTPTSIALKLAAAASLALAGVALAHPHEGGEGEGKDKVHKVIVLRGPIAKDSKDAAKRIREFRMMRGADGTFTCPNGDETKIDETTGGDRTKILICGDDKLSGAERAKKLEDALARIRSQDHLSAEHKGKVEAALQEAISRLRTSN
jgi:hypothetical protein